jgi:hypothetical protein
LPARYGCSLAHTKYTVIMCLGIPYSAWSPLKKYKYSFNVVTSVHIILPYVRVCIAISPSGRANSKDRQTSHVICWRRSPISWFRPKVPSSAFLSCLLVEKRHESVRSRDQWPNHHPPSHHTLNLPYFAIRIILHVRSILRFLLLRHRIRICAGNR